MVLDLLFFCMFFVKNNKNHKDFLDKYTKFKIVGKKVARNGGFKNCNM